MDKKRQEGYVTGIGCLFLCILFAYFAVMSISNTQAAGLMGIFAGFFGVLGFGSLAKPETFGAAAAEYLRRLSQSSEGRSTDSHNRQIQTESNGSFQVMTGDQAEVHITTVPSMEKKEEEKPPMEENEILRKETIVISPSDGYSYEFQCMEGDHLKGEILSNNRIDVYFVDELNLGKWQKGKSFDYEDSSEAILEANVDYLAPTEGTWHLIIENNGRKSATIKIQLYVKK
jgi:hypothetical protein